MAAAVALPKFAGLARKAEHAAEGEKGSKAQRVVQEAQAAAAGGGRRGKAGNKEVLEQLVQILAKLTLANSNDLREVMGMVLKTYLIPEKHIIATASLAAGKDYQEAAKKQKEKRANAKKDEESDEESDIEDQSSGEKKPMDEDSLGAPHLIIAMQAIHQLIVADRSQWGEQAQRHLKELENTWVQMKIGEMQETEAIKLVKVWRARKPQKQNKGHRMGKYVKINFAMEEKLADAVHKVILETGGMEKVGKAPRGFLEREASRLLQKFQKQCSARK